MEPEVLRSLNSIAIWVYTMSGASVKGIRVEDSKQILDKLLNVVNSCQTNDQLSNAEEWARTVLFNIRSHFHSSKSSNATVEEFFLFALTYLTPLVYYKHITINKPQ